MNDFITSEELLQQLDLSFRVGASALTLVICFVFLRGLEGRSRAFLVLAVLVALPIYLLQQHFFSGQLRYAAVFAEALLPGAIWLLVRSDINNNIAFDRTSWVLLLGFLPTMRLVWIVSAYYNWQFIGHLSWWVGYSFIAGLIGVIIKTAYWGLEDELVDGQRLAKRQFLLLVAAGFSTALAQQILVGIPTYGGSDQFLFSVLFSLPFFILVLLAAIFILTVNTDNFVLIQGTSLRNPGDVVISLDARQEVLDLKALMEEEQAFLQPGLSVPILAGLAKVPEYRLRQLINQELGYRNFYDYLNFYRITEAEKRLGNSELRRTSVLTIAMDIGYRSVGPFNKAFKDRTGQTPTEYRRRVLNGDVG